MTVLPAPAERGSRAESGSRAERGSRGGRRSAADRPPRRPTAADGLVIVDKPAGWTSHDVVARMRGIAGTKKVGHAGTLDPMATGVLVLGIGRATRLLTYVVGADKEYTATIRLGVSTTTDDAEGEVLARTDASAVNRAAIDAGVAALTGPIQQVPSTVSAIKVDGQRAYARARAGEEFELAARPVTISCFEVGAVRRHGLAGDVAAGKSLAGEVLADDGGPVVDLDVRVVCTSGTYIRALARDLGAGLGVGGHLTALRRTRVGGYPLAVARTLDELEAHPADTPLDVLGLAEAARATFPVRDLTAAEAAALSYGKRIDAGEATASEPVAAIAPDGTLIALLATEGPRARPVLVFAPA